MERKNKANADKNQLILILSINFLYLLVKHSHVNHKGENLFFLSCIVTCVCLYHDFCDNVQAEKPENVNNQEY